MRYRSILMTLVLMTIGSVTGLAGMKWIQLSPTGDVPPGTGANTAIYAAASNRLIVFGGTIPVGSSWGHTNGLYILTNANGLGGTPVWQRVPVSGAWPSPRSASHAAYDQANDRMMVFGGRLWGSLLTNEVWVLRNASGTNGTPEWTMLTPNNQPPAVRTGAMVNYDSTSNQLIVFGGAGNYNAHLNDAWVLTHANGLGGIPEWLQLSPGGTAPAGRCCGAAHLDPATNRLIVFGGGGVPAPHSDSWHLLNPTGFGVPQWLPIAPLSPTPDRYNFASAYRPDTNELVVALGVSQGQLVTSVWKLQNANGIGLPAWVEVFPSGPLPKGRDGVIQAGLDEGTGRLMIFGGSDSTGTFLNDVWVLADDTPDSTPPLIVPTVSPIPNASGWNKEDVVVSFAVSDPESGIASSTGCDSVTLTSETNGMTFTCSATNGAGLTDSKTVTVRIDKTAPQISIVTPANGASYVLGAGLQASYTCADPVSGVADCIGTVPSGSPLDTLTVGQNQQFTVSATDVAGNQATATAAYAVSYAFLGFFQPIDNYPIINVVKAGRTIPVKWQVKNAAGEIISDLTTVKGISSGAIACDLAPTSEISDEALTTGGTSLRFDFASQQFVYNWETASAWNGCRLLRVELKDSTVHIAKFQFR